MNNKECLKLAHELSIFIGKTILKEVSGKSLSEALEFSFVTILVGIAPSMGAILAEFENNENFSIFVESILNDFSKDLKERVNSQIVRVREDKLKEVH